MLFQPCFLGGREDARTAVKSVAPFSVREPPEIFRPSSFSCRVRLDCWRWERPHREGSASLRVASRKKSKRNKRSKSRLCPILRRAASFRLVVLAGARRIAGEGLAVVTSERSGFWRGPLRQPRHMIAGQPLGGDAGALLGEAAEAHARCAPNPASSPAWRRAGGSLRPAANLDLARPVSPLIPSRPRRPSARPNCRIARAGVCSNASPNSVTCLNFPGGQAFASMVCSGFRQSGNRLAVSNRRVGFDCEVQQLRDIAISARCTPPEICLCGIAIGTRRSGSFLKRFAL